MVEPPFLIVGMGRSGTTALAQVLARQPGLMHVEEPNFITSLYIPVLEGTLPPEQLLANLRNEGWRGPMKFCRTMAEMYPDVFDDSGRSPIRAMMREECARVLAELHDCGQSRVFDILKSSVERIVEDTCRLRGARRWLVKQPNAVLYCDRLLRLWPGMKVLHVARRLEDVVRSRLVRGYQASFSEALQVCRTRLAAALTLGDAIGPANVRHVSIEHVAECPRQQIEAVCSFLGCTATEATEAAADTITMDALHRLGSAAWSFSVDELAEIAALRQWANDAFGETLV